MSVEAAAAAAMAGELKATRQKKRRTKKHREQAELAAASSESPQPPATPESKPESPFPIAPETLTSTAVAAEASRRGKERKRKMQGVVAAASPVVEEPVRTEGKKKHRRSKHEEAAACPIVEEPVRTEGKKKHKRSKHEEAVASPIVEEPVRMEGKKKHKRSKYEEAAAILWPSAAAATAQILEVAAEGAVVRKEWRQGKVKQGQSGQPSLSVGVHSQGGESAADPGISGSQSVKRSSSGKPRVLSDRKIMRIRIETMKKEPMPQGFIPHTAFLNSIDQDPNYSSPLGAFFDQFRYEPDHRQSRNAPSFPKTPDRPARPPPQDHQSSLSSQLTANETFMAAKTTTSNTMRPRSASASGPQEEVKVKEKKKAEKKMSMIKKPRKPAPVLSAAEKRSDKYRRLPLNLLVRPPRSPHKLLQEKYAYDPWKVIVICMLLNLTQGKQVRKIVKGFFKLYPDAQTAYAADPEKMAEYLAPLGLQRVKTTRIQKFSKAYVEEEWTYITELCGVGKYAADAYAIFCAGRAREVVPEDHKLVDYWKYVCFELPLIQAPQEAAGVTRQGNFAPEVQQITVSC